MKKVVLFVAIVTLGLGSVARAQTTTTLPAPRTCEDFRCEFQQQLNDQCDCTRAANHGQYVSCVAHLIKTLVDQGMPVNCKGKLQRCAARSVCGKQSRGFQTCTTYQSNTCNLDPILLTSGTCSNDTSVTCATNADCTTESCKITRHAETCVAENQALDVSPTCCSSCKAPVAAPTPAP